MVSTSSALSICALVAGVGLMLLVHILVVFWALRRGLGDRGTSREEEPAEDGCGGVGQGLSADELETLPCYDFKAASAAAGGGGGGDDDCAVCLEAFEAGDRCRRLPRCEHSFHAPCVDSWLRKSRCCPVCRAGAVDLTKDELKAAGEGEAAEAVEMVERRSPAALEIVVER